VTGKCESPTKNWCQQARPQQHEGDETTFQNYLTSIDSSYVMVPTDPSVVEFELSDARPLVPFSGIEDDNDI
jgi:hypothetical protein